MPVDVPIFRQRLKTRAGETAALLLALSVCLPAAAAELSLDPADQALDAGQVRRARELYVAVHLLAADPGLAARAAEQAAWCESLLGKYDEAASRLETLLRDLEGDGARRARLLNLLGEVRLNQAIGPADHDPSPASFAAAEKALRDAMTVASGIPGAEDPARYNLGRCLYHAARFEQAAETLAPLAGRNDGSILSSQAEILMLLAHLNIALREPGDAIPAAVGPHLDRLEAATAALDDRLLANEAIGVAATLLLAAHRPGDALDWSRRVLSREDLIASAGAAAARLRAALESAEATGSDADALRRDLQRLRIRHDELASHPDPRIHAGIVAAESLLLLGQTESSVDAFRDLLLRDDLPASAAARVRAGMIRACADLGEPEHAVSVLEEVHETLGRDASAELAFAVAQTAIETGDFALAAETLDLSRRLAPAGPRAATALYQEGALRLTLDEYARAANLLERFLDQTTEPSARTADAWFRLGCAQTALGEHEHAAAAIEQSLAISPPESAARRRGLLQLARLKILLDQPDEALPHLDELESGAEHREERRRILVLRADALEAMGRLEQSAAAWREISLHADSPLEEAAALWRAVIDLDAAGLREPADGICRTLASGRLAGPHVRAALQRLLRRAIEQGDISGAEAILAGTPPERPEDLLELARLWLDQGSRRNVEIEEARRRARETYERVAVEFAETSQAAEALALLAELHETSGNPDEARRARARLLRAYPAHPEARKLRARQPETP